MKPDRRDEQRLTDIIDAASAAIRFLGDRDEKVLGSDELLGAALVQKITVIGEAASRVSPRTRTALADLPWQDMVGMRNRVAHHHWQIAVPTLWATVHDELPRLAERLHASRERWRP